VDGRTVEAVEWLEAAEPESSPLGGAVDGTSEDEPGLPQQSEDLRGDEGLLLASQGFS